MNRNIIDYIKQISNQNRVARWLIMSAIGLLILIVVLVALNEIGTSDVVDVKDYGAIGDGIIDDSKAVITALFEAQTRNMTLYFPPGQYNLNNTSITVNTDLKIAGEPDGSSKLINPGALSCSGNVSLKDITVSDDKDIFIYMQPAGMVNLNIDHVMYTGNAGSTRFVYCKSETSGVGIEKVEIVNCTISNTRYGIMLACPINSGLISGNIFDTIGDPAIFQGVAAIKLGYLQSHSDSARNITISNNRITNVAAGYSTTNDGRECQGILLLSDGGCVIENNYLENIVGGRDTEGIYCKAVDIKILNNTLINAGEGDGSIVNKRTSSENDVIISGNTIVNTIESSRTMCGIYVASEKYTITYNNITLIRGIAIYNANETLDAVITDNTINAFGRTAIYASGISGNALISDNKISLIQESNEQLDSAINMSGTKSTGIVEVSNNEIYIENTCLFNVYNAEKGASFTVLNNKFSSNAEFADKTIGLSGIEGNNNVFTVIK